MRRTYLGEFEEIVLLMLAIRQGQAYGVTVSQALEEHPGRVMTVGSVHNTPIRREEKGFVTSQRGGATAERGDRRKRPFRATALGNRAGGQDPGHPALRAQRGLAGPPGRWCLLGAPKRTKTSLLPTIYSQP